MTEAQLLAILTNPPKSLEERKRLRRLRRRHGSSLPRKFVGGRSCLRSQNLKLKKSLRPGDWTATQRKQLRALFEQRGNCLEFFVAELGRTAAGIAFELRRQGILTCAEFCAATGRRYPDPMGQFPKPDVDLVDSFRPVRWSMDMDQKLVDAFNDGEASLAAFLENHPKLRYYAPFRLELLQYKGVQQRRFFRIV